MGHPPGAGKPPDADNHRNGTSGKTILTDDGPLRYARGETHAAIAAALGIAPATVRNHIARCFKRLAVNSKVELSRRLQADLP